MHETQVKSDGLGRVQTPEACCEAPTLHRHEPNRVGVMPDVCTYRRRRYDGCTTIPLAATVQAAR